MVRLNSIQALRAIAAIVVVIYHFNAVEIYLGDKVETPFFSLLYFFGYGGVNLFFVISGFIITWVHHRELGDRTRAASYLRKRLVRLFPVYWVVWIAAAWISYSLLKDDYCVDTGAFWHLFQSAFLVQTNLVIPDIHNCFVPQAWSLSWELLFYCSFLLFFFVRREVFAPVLILWTCSILGGHALDLPFLEQLAIFSPLNLQFIGGCVVGVLALRHETRFAVPSLVLGLAWVAVSIALNATGRLSVDLDWHRVIEFGFASIFIVYGMVALEMKMGERNFPPWLIELGNASYSIYLTHLATFLALRRLLADMPHTIGVHAIYAALLILAAILIGWLVYRYVEAPILAAFRGVSNNSQSFGYVAACLLLTIAGGAVLTRSYDQIIPTAFAFDSNNGSLEQAGPNTILNLNGVRLSVTDERQGWVSKVRATGELLEIGGWALDRVRNRTALSVLVFVDGKLVQAQAPMHQFRAVEDGVTFFDGHRPGFRFTLPDAVGRDVRVFALLPDNRVGELYYPPDFPPR
ncbi:acyltransferase 3 [Rhizobium sp. PDO1-076]|uniref:acyltransferase family protein n=1 Tax=Rhizobium sp. PDO1-076 TaxID=1125979 RepID=UPI00024E3436|nr:acyltransferase [Rhizobium sp. PDO1-076]EHS51479.1 acyltransferase 3 [Rhizobium sp. PDO1-076]